ncbi:MAG: arylsulfatase, partial [Prolixibacteraceae bacterium]|nr:arylsulfatase [Prolixibacteraceae bacterium]
ITQSEYGGEEKKVQETPLLYNLELDPSEKYNITEEHPEIIKEMKEVLEEHLSTLIPVENQLEK